MQGRSRPLRWGMLVVLALGVILMHHAPALHTPAHEGPAVAAVHSTQVHTIAGSASLMEQASEKTMLSKVSNPDDTLDSSHAMLHMCLAIVTGLALLLLTAATGLLQVRLPWAKHAPYKSRSRFRPPLPVPRRLAVLCVLRL